MSGGTSSMDGASWVVLIIVIILTVLLSTICSWFNALVMAVGKTLAWTIVSIVIAVLIIALMVLLITNPDAFDKILDLALNSSDKIGSQINKILDKTTDTVFGPIKTVVPLVIVGLSSFYIYKRISNEKD